MMNQDANAEPRFTAPIPAWARVTHALAMIGGFGLYCGLMYVLVRPLFGSFGFDLESTLKSVIAVIFLGCFVFFLIPLVDLPLIWYRHQKPRMRAEKGCCPACGHTATPEQRERSCPECGSRPEQPPTWRPNLGTLRRFLLFLLLAIVLGSATGEWSLIADERRFEREASLRNYPEPTTSYSRPRTWPNGHAWLNYSPEAGTTASRFMGSSRVNRWNRGEE